MDPTERIELSKLIKEYDADDNTSRIRELKHSQRIRADVGLIEQLKQTYSRIYKSNFSQFKTIAMKRANFLYDNYTNIFNRLIKNELNLNILWQFLEVLRRIEEGEMDQHEGSVLIGKLLKTMYIDSVIQQDSKQVKREAKQQKGTQSVSSSEQQYKKISWKTFKQEQNDE